MRRDFDDRVQSLGLTQNQWRTIAYIARQESCNQAVDNWQQDWAETTWEIVSTGQSPCKTKGFGYLLLADTQ